MIRSSRSQHGMTLVELIVVMGVIAIMGGFAVGMMRRGDSALTIEANGQLVRSILRQARNSARSTGGGVMVRLDPEYSTVEASPMELGGNWHFEDESTSRREIIPSAVELVEEGRMGRAARLDGSTIDLGDSIFFRGDQGLRLDMWIKPETLADAKIAARENCWKLAINDEGALRAEIALGGEQRDTIGLQTRSGVVRAGHWHRVTLGYDRIEVTIEVDGVLQAARKETRPLYVDPKAHLVAGGGYTGLIDEMRLDVARSGLVEELSNATEMTPDSDLVVRFDGRGRLDRRFHVRPVRIVLIGDAEAEELPDDAPVPREEIRIEFSGVIR